MSLLDLLPFAGISEQDLQLLVSNGVAEGRDLEFKAVPYGNADGDRREFLKDATAMANTVGGHIVIGIAEANGVASALQPITSSPADTEKLRLENILLASVEPRLIGVQMREVPVPAGYVLVLRVPRSWNPPHRVTHGGSNRYWLRHSSGAYEPTVDQLRTVFLGGADMERRLLEFRLDRLARLGTGERGFLLRARAQLVLQVVPLAEGAFDMPTVTTATTDFAPLNTRSGHTWRYNLEGLLIHSPVDQRGSVVGYTQVFRNGRVEMARGGYIREMQDEGTSQPFVAAGLLLNSLVNGVTRCLKGAAKHGAAYPMAVMISFLNAQGTCLATSNDGFEVANLLDRADLLFSPVIAESEQDALGGGGFLLPIFDAFWNAYGQPQCGPVRNPNGEWTGLPQGWR